MFLFCLHCALLSAKVQKSTQYASQSGTPLAAALRLMNAAVNGIALAIDA